MVSKEKTPSKKTLAVLFGGRSVEHEISVITALQAISIIDGEKFTVIPVYIAPDGRWFTGEILLERKTYQRVPQILDECTEVTLLPKPGSSALLIVSSATKGLGTCGEKRQIPIDVFVPIFHGQYGEDGCIQGLFEMADVAYTGCPPTASVMAMNKYLCKLALKSHGIPVLPAIQILRRDALKDLSGAVKEALKFNPLPLFIKPCNLGSSIGVSRVLEEREIAPALAQVFKYDDAAIIEPCVTNLLEINVSVRDTPNGYESSVVEVPISQSGVLSYEEKYLRDGGKKTGDGGASQGMASLTRIIDPPDLDPAIKARVNSLAESIFKLLGCSGDGRFDFMMDGDSGELYFNELNPTPGSLAFYLWAKSTPQVLFPEIITTMVECALIRKGEKDSLDRNIGLKALRS